MPTFRKKPEIVEVEAVRFTKIDGDTLRFASHPPQWLLDAMQMNNILPGALFIQDVRLVLQNRGGGCNVNDGDWIVRTNDGAIFSCKPDVFAATYYALEA